MKINKQVLALSVALLIPFTSQANPLLGIARSLGGLAVGGATIGGIMLPTAVGYHAGVQREKLQAEVKEFKKGLNSEQLAIFSQSYQPCDTDLATKVPFLMQIFGFGLVDTHRSFNTITTTLKPIVKHVVWPAALLVAAGTEYVEYKNRKDFKDAVDAVQSSVIQK